MKIIKHLFIFLSISQLFSCSDTIIKEIPSPTTVDAPPASGYFKKRVLIEDYTGTWCGFCTRVSQGIDLVPTVTDKAVVVAIHGGSVGSDPYITPFTMQLKNYFFSAAPNKYPEVRLNRTSLWNKPEAQNLNDVKKLTGNNCALGLALNSNLTGGNLNVEVKIKFVELYSNLRLVVYVVENSLIYDQVNYTSTYYGGQDPIPNYVHDHVLRHSLTNVLGNNITENINLSQIITKNYNQSIPTNISNTSNIGLIAFVIDANNNVINVRYAKINENQIFEEN